MIDYDPHHWRSHLFDIHGSVAREIAARVLVCVLWSVVVVVAVRYGGERLSIPTTIHGLVGVAIGLLLVFRTNVSYDRYWEGRRMWGNIINVSRDLGRGAAVHLADDPARRDAVLGWTAAFGHAVMEHLQDRSGIGPMAGRLPPELVSGVAADRSVPLAVAARIGAELRAARDAGLISDVILAHLDLDVRQFIDALGACERIKRSPMPFAYVVHLRRVLLIYCMTLPFGLVRDFGWGTVLDTLLVTYIFFGVEEIGVQIENPFGTDPNDLPMERFCATIEAELASQASAASV